MLCFTKVLSTIHRHQHQSIQYYSVRYNTNLNNRPFPLQSPTYGRHKDHIFYNRLKTFIMSSYIFLIIPAMALLLWWLSPRVRRYNPHHHRQDQHYWNPHYPDPRTQRMERYSQQQRNRQQIALLILLMLMLVVLLGALLPE